MTQQKKTSYLLIIATLLITVSLTKFTDHDPITLPREEDNLEKEMLEFQKEALTLLEKDLEKISEEQLAKLESLKQTTQWACTGGKDPRYLDTKQYLQAFADGPCAPAVFVPGIMGSKLVTKIDCNLLMANDPDTFKACGWTGCGFLSKKPNAEYRIWIPRLTSPASLLKPYGSSKRCFAGLIALRFMGKGDTVKVIPKAGVSVDTIGSTPTLGDQKKDYRCGFDAIESLLPIVGTFKGTMNFKYINEAFINAGYLEGLTAQALPYDFRIDTRDNLLNKKFKKVVNELNEITGKKVAIFAHSFGNFQTMNYLWGLTQAEKDAKIARYFAIAPPLGGAVKPVVSFIGMDSSYSKGLIIAKVGLTFDFFDLAADTFQGMFNLFPQGHFSQKKNERFVQLMLQKINAEKNKQDVATGSIWDVFPKFNSQCVVGFKGMPDNCNFGLNDMSDFGRIKQERLTFETMETLLKKYSYSEYSGDVYKKSVDSRFLNLANPGVQVNVVFGSTSDTHQSIEYYEDPKTKTSQGKMFDPNNVVMGQGDGSVLSTSALIAGIKWGEEFRMKAANSKPVNFLHMCSSYNKKSSIWQSGKTVTQNSYMGIDCTCKGSVTSRVDGDKCSGHAEMLEEPGLVRVLLDGAIDGQKGTVGQRFLTMDAAGLNNYRNGCVMFNQY